MLPFVLITLLTFLNHCGDTCIPTCRTGFQCVSASCVTICNPACESSETCTAAGECETSTTESTDTTTDDTTTDDTTT